MDRNGSAPGQAKFGSNSKGLGLENLRCAYRRGNALENGPEKAA